MIEATQRKMQIHGKNIVGSELSNSGTNTFRAYHPRAGKEGEHRFYEATSSEIDRALNLAGAAAARMATIRANAIADFLSAIREEILGLGDLLIDAASEETALDVNRLRGERDRTVNQIKLFVDIVTEGSWVDARIDPAQPDRKPLPRPDIRRMLQPVGAVAVFGASNFPLAFSVAGGDTISALASRNPVIVKAHPAHPATSELVGMAITRAVKSASMPEGAFSMLHARSPDVSLALTSHPKTKAVAFTGSQRAGRALFDVAARRPCPIPVFAEMGSVNPVFVLPGAIAKDGEGLAEGLLRSVLLGVGQFCTSPGLVFGAGGERMQGFLSALTQKFEAAQPGTMLNSAIRDAYSSRVESLAKLPGVRSQHSAQAAKDEQTEGQPVLFSTDLKTWLHNTDLHEEIFGPATVLVTCGSDGDLLEAATALEGSLTATIHGTPEDLARNTRLIEILSSKAGRLIFNGFPTGVEVGYAMHHGGPYPATTDEKFTSVGATSIYRFSRPICYQNFPEHLLPEELQNKNPRNIWRMIDGRLTRDPIDEPAQNGRDGL